MQIVSIKQLKYINTNNKKIIILTEKEIENKNKNILVIKCRDTESKTKTAFKEEDAKRILKHIENTNKKNIIVACDCGISRSAAVGAAILRKYKQDGRIWRSAQYTPNILIYDTLCKEQGIKNNKIYLKYLKYINKKAFKKQIAKTRKKACI